MQPNSHIFAQTSSNIVLDGSEESLSTQLRDLSDIDNNRVVMVRKINRLGLESASPLKTKSQCDTRDRKAANGITSKCYCRTIRSESRWSKDCKRRHNDAETIYQDHLDPIEMTRMGTELTPYKLPMRMQDHKDEGRVHTT